MGQAQLSPEELLRLAAALKKAVRIKDRRYLFRSYPRCFVGQEAVAWLISSGAASSPAEAVKLGNELMEMGIFHHVCYEHVFEDDYLFYRFTDDDAILLDPPGGDPAAVDLRAAAGTPPGGALPHSPCDGRSQRSGAGGSDVPPSPGPSPSPGPGPGPSSAEAAGSLRRAPPPGQQPQDRSSQPKQRVGDSGAARARGPAADGAAAAAAAAPLSGEGGGALGRLLETRTEKQDRMRWQVMAGHLQALQGRVTHIQSAAEAQRAIADILVSECNLLHGQVSELRGRLDTAAAALQAAAAAADQTAQQLASLRLLCAGLCACLLQQAIESGLRPSGAVAAAAGGGALLSGGGTRWGLALALAVTVMGLTMLLSQRRAAATAPCTAVWFANRSSAKMLAGGVAGGVAGGCGGGEQQPAAPDGRGGGASEDECDAAAAAGGGGGGDVVLERASVSPDSPDKLVGRSVSAEPLGARGPEKLRCSVTADVYGDAGAAAGGVGGGVAALSRRATRVARLLTAPMRLHLSRGEKQSDVHRTYVQQPPSQPPSAARGAFLEAAAAAAAAATAAAAVPAGAGSADDTAYDTPMAAAVAAATPGRSSEVGGGCAAAGAAVGDDHDGSRSLPAICLDDDKAADTDAANASGHPHPHPNHPNHQRVQPPSAATAAAATAAAGGIFPRMSDFAGWPDAPVLLAFDTRLVPEHAAATAAVPTAAVRRSSLPSSGAEEPSVVGSEGKRDSDQAGDLLVNVTAGCAAAPTGSSVRHAAPPPPPPGGVVRLRANGVAPIRIETELFSGEVVVLLRGLASAPESLFSGKKRMSWIAMQGRFKKSLALDSVVTGQEFARPFRRLPAPWFVERVLLSMARRISSSMRVGPLSAPSLLMPLIASAQLVNVSRPGQQAPLMQCKEDVRLFCPRLSVKGRGGSMRPLPATVEARRRHFSSARNRAGLEYDTENVWTFHFWQHFVDLVSYRLDFGYTYDLVQHLDGQPLQIMAKDVDSGRYLYSILVWNERLVAGAAGAPAAAAAAARYSDAGGLARSSIPEEDAPLPGDADDTSPSSSYDGRSSGASSGRVGGLA